MADLCVALLLRLAAYMNQYASGVVVARLDLDHLEPPASTELGSASRATSMILHA